MSAGGGLLSQVVGSLGGAPAATALVLGGIVVGALGGGAIAGGAFTGGSATSAGELSVYPCPDTGPALFTVPGGQAFLVTGKTGDGTWLRIHNPVPGRTEAWVQADPLTVKGSLADVPVAECAPEIEAAAASGSPYPSLTAVQMNSPSPSPSPSPAPTENPRPSLKGLTASTTKISYDTGAYCPKAVKKVTFTVKASDSSGVAGVTLFWREPGADTYAQSAMSRTAGSATNGTWQVTLDTTKDGITKAGKLAFYAVATDNDGATRRLPAKGSDTITVAVCVNTGPTIKSAASSSGSNLSWKPLRTGTCAYPTATNIRSRVDDVDGVAFATLFFRPPGEGWRSKPMTLSSGRWTASLDTGSDDIGIADPPTDNLRWYVKATDKEGLESQSGRASIEIHRCDTEANFGNSGTNPTYFCPGKPTSFYVFVTDADGLTGSSAVLVYKYRATDGRTKTKQAQMTRGIRDRYEVTINGPSDLATISAAALVTTFEIRTTDQYGGRSRGGAGQVLQGCR